MVPEVGDKEPVVGDEEPVVGDEEFDADFDVEAVFGVGDEGPVA